MRLAPYNKPSVLITNETGSPYSPGKDLSTECCQLVYEATSEFVSGTTRSNPFHIYRKFVLASLFATCHFLNIAFECSF